MQRQQQQRTLSLRAPVSSLYTLAMTPFTLLVFFAVELPRTAVAAVLNAVYVVVQTIVILLFKPRLPVPDKSVKHRGRIAVIGGGLTGVSSAAHAIAHGFDVVIYEKNKDVGGIWASVNETSALQLNSLLYRFHPAVAWKKAFPGRDEIVSEIKRIHKEYDLISRTRFNSPVMSVKRVEGTSPPSEDHPEGQSRWTINDGADGEFDAIIVTVGTCGPPNMVTMKGMPGWKDEQKRQEETKKEQHEQEHEPPSRTDIDKPTQDDANANGHGRAAQDAGVWEETKPKENAWDVSRDQVEKREQGFPKPGEVFQPGPDVQKPVEEVLDEGIHDMVRETGSVVVGTRKRGEKKGKAHHNNPYSHHHGKHEHEGENGHEAANGQHGTEVEDDNDEDVFQGPILHSSALDRDGAPSFEDKTVVVIGGGASAVETVETALAKGAKKCVVVARDDKWIIPRNFIIDTLISAQPFGREMPLSFIVEWLITFFHYHGVEDLVPYGLGLFESTPVVNNQFLRHVRNGRCEYVRGDTERLTQRGVYVNARPRESKPGDKGTNKEIDADIVVMATGFHKPDISFLPEDLFPKGYDRPNLYLQNFSTEDWSVLMTNTAYVNAIGTVGHFHIGIYARVLMTFLMDKDARPSPKDMKLWVDVVRFVKRGARGGALGFFTYMELTIWLVLFHLLRLDRLKWLFFIMQGWGVTPQYT